MNTVADNAGTSDSEERIAAALLGRGRLKDIDLARAQRLQAEAGGSLATLMVRLGLVSERDMAEAASDVLGLPLVSAKDCPDVPPENLPLTLRFLKQQAVCPVGEDAAGIDLLVADPQDDYAAGAVRLATGGIEHFKTGHLRVLEIDEQTVELRTLGGLWLESANGDSPHLSGPVGSGAPEG